MCGYFCIGFIDFIQGNTSTDFTNLFSPNNFQKNDDKLFYDQCLKMVKCDSHETPNLYPNLSAPSSNQQQFRPNKINKIKDCFVAGIKERQLMSKRLSKYIASFDYFDKSLFYL